MGPFCRRNTLPLLPITPASSRSYHEFDDVLLVVFFSHARYNINIEYYREVYAEYFPNVRTISMY